MRKLMLVGLLGLVLLTGGRAEASVSGAFQNVWTYLSGFVTCAVARGGALLDWTLETATCAIRTVNKNPVNLAPIVTAIPHD